MTANEVAGIGQPSLDEIKKMTAASGPCLSILLPVDPTRRHPLKMGPAIEAAQRKLDEKSVDARESRRLLEPIQDFAKDAEKWADLPSGLALYCAPEVFRIFRVAHTLDECIEVGDHFYVKPLLPLLHADRTFYILALSQKHIRLLRCTDSTADEVALPASVPTNLLEDSQTDQPDHVLDNRMSAGPSVGAMKGVSFTTSTDRENKDEYLLKFYKDVSRGVAELLKNDGAPLVVAGVDYEIALYRRENSYPHLAEDAVHGAADGLKGGELHKRALEAVAPFFDASLKQTIARFEELAGSEKVSTTAREIVVAAFDGRVADLILAETARYMGNFDEATHRVRGHKEPLPGDEDLLNAAAVETLLHSGQVFVVPSSKVPHGAPAAAVLRY